MYSVCLYKLFFPVVYCFSTFECFDWTNKISVVSTNKWISEVLEFSDRYLDICRLDEGTSKYDESVGNVLSICHAWAVWKGSVRGLHIHNASRECTIVQYTVLDFVKVLFQTRNMIQFSMRLCNTLGPNMTRSNGIHQVIAFPSC